MRKIFFPAFVAASAVAGVAVCQIPTAPRDPDFARIALPANHDQCLPGLFRSSARRVPPTDIHADAETRNARRLMEKRTELQSAEDIHVWLETLADPSATQVTRNAALSIACASAQAIISEFPDHQVLMPLSGVQMGDDWALRYRVSEYTAVRNRIRGEVAALHARDLRYRFDRWSIPATATPAPAPRPQHPKKPNKAQKRTQLPMPGLVA